MKLLLPLVLMIPHLALAQPIQCHGSSYRYDASVTADVASRKIEIRIKDQGGEDLIQLDSDPELTHLIPNSLETVLSFRGLEKLSGQLLNGTLRLSPQSGRLTVESSFFGLQYCR